MKFTTIKTSQKFLLIKHNHDNPHNEYKQQQINSSGNLLQPKKMFVVSVLQKRINNKSNFNIVTDKLTLLQQECHKILLYFKLTKKDVQSIHPIREAVEIQLMMTAFYR